MNTVEILTAARDHIAAPKGWTRGTYQRKVKGAPEGVSCCAVGAVEYHLDSGTSWVVRRSVRDAAYEALNAQCGGNVIGFNDKAKSKKPVIAAFDAAIASLS